MGLKQKLFILVQYINAIENKKISKNKIVSRLMWCDQIRKEVEIENASSVFYSHMHMHKMETWKYENVIVTVMCASFKRLSKM